MILTSVKLHQQVIMLSPESLLVCNWQHDVVKRPGLVIQYNAALLPLAKLHDVTCVLGCSLKDGSILSVWPKPP